MRIFIISVVLHFTLYAGIINAIAITVNDEPITLIDIDNKMKIKGISKEEAVKLLIDENLYDQQLKKFNIVVDQFDIDRYIEKLALNNNMSLYAFKNALKQQQDFETFEAKVKKQLKHQKLVSMIAANKITRATDEDMMIYYQNNNHEFQVPNTIDVIHYASKDKNALESIKRNPMMQNQNVVVENTTINLATSSSQTQYILTQTKVDSYSAIFAEDGAYHLYYVSNKKDIQDVPFEKVKNNIFSYLMTQREEAFLKNYFEGLKISAKIIILR